MAKVTDRERAIDTLQRLYDYAWSEQQIANQQSQQAREVKDFRAMDRHASYASAMQKMQQRVDSFARNLYMHDVTTASHRQGISENAKLHNEANDSESRKDPYAKCESFSDVCKKFMEVDPQMKKFFGKGKDGE